MIKLDQPMETKVADFFKPSKWAVTFLRTSTRDSLCQSVVTLVTCHKHSRGPSLSQAALHLSTFTGVPFSLWRASDASVYCIRVYAPPGKDARVFPGRACRWHRWAARGCAQLRTAARLSDSCLPCASPVSPPPAVRCTDCWQSNKRLMIADHHNIITDWPLLYVYQPFMFLLISAVCPYNLSFPYKSVCSFCRLCNIPFVGCVGCKRLFLSSKVCFFVFFYFAYEWFYLVKAFSISVFWYVYFFFYSFSFFISLSWYQQYIFCMLYS